MDGNGSIQVNHWRKRNLQYRLIIKLKYSVENVKMLYMIKKDIGGMVIKIHRKENECIIWVVDNKKVLSNIIKIFEKYPPITYRLNAQLIFLKSCLVHNSINLYFGQRNNKYVSTILFNQNLKCDYFNEWLSGFIEAEGCFSLRKNNSHSFSIGQKNEKELIEYIKMYFAIQTKLRYKKNDFWFIETYRKSTLLNIIKHCDNYPLLGQKLISFNKLKKEYYKYKCHVVLP
jgi:hypothetical protein